MQIIKIVVTCIACKESAKYRKKTTKLLRIYNKLVIILSIEASSLRK